MIEIPFEEFFNGTKDKLSLEFIRFLNPGLERYFRIRNTFVAVQFERKRKAIWIKLAVGRDAKWILEFVRDAKQAGFEAIGFQTSPLNVAVKAIAAHYKLLAVATGETYEDGQPKIIYEGNLLTNKRLGAL